MSYALAFLTDPEIKADIFTTVEFSCGAKYPQVNPRVVFPSSLFFLIRFFKRFAFTRSSAAGWISVRLEVYRVCKVKLYTVFIAAPGRNGNAKADPRARTYTRERTCPTYPTYLPIYRSKCNFARRKSREQPRWIFTQPVAHGRRARCAWF